MDIIPRMEICPKVSLDNFVKTENRNKAYRNQKDRKCFFQIKILNPFSCRDKNFMFDNRN